MKTEVIPVVVGALGTVKKEMVENIKKVSERATVTEIQKIRMLGSARILWGGDGGGGGVKGAYSV